MSEFAQIVTDLTNDEKGPLNWLERWWFAAVLYYKNQLRSLYGYLNIDLDNLEHLFGLIDMKASLASGDDQSLREYLIFVLLKTIELTRRAADPELEVMIQEHRKAGDVREFRRLRTLGAHPLASYVDFARDLRPHDVVLTFNYDTVLEDALLAAGIGPDYGFAAPKWSHVDRNQQVLKLHGSVNFIDQGGSVLPVDHELLEQPTLDFFKLGTPLIVPPTWNKSNPGGVIQDIWARANSALQTAHSLVFIGYSLPETDLFFRYLLATALADNTLLRSFSVLDPGKATQDRYAKFVSQVMHDQGKFKQIVNPFPQAWHEFR